MKINQIEINKSIWLMLPVSSLIVMAISLVMNGFVWNVLLVPVLILTYGVFIWGPSMLMTLILERLIIRENSPESTVLMVFGIETACTFMILAVIFTTGMTWVPFLALGMSVFIQLTRWWYLKRTNRLYKGSFEQHLNPEIIDQ